MIYTATDALGNVASHTYSVNIVNVAFPVPDEPADQGYTASEAITAQTLPEAIGGTTPLTYTLTGPSGSALPTGLIFTAANRELSGTPTIPGIYELTYTVTDAAGFTAEKTFMVAVFSAVTIDDQVYITGQDVALTLPEFSGGAAPLSYTLTRSGGATPILAPGLNFTSRERIISGVPTVSFGGFGGASLRYTVTDANGISVAVSFTMRVFGFNQESTIDDQVYVETVEFTLSLPTPGGGTLSYTLRPTASIPDGLLFDATALTLTGTPTTASVAVTLTYTATEAVTGLTDEQTFIITGFSAPTTIADQVYTVSQSVTLTLPEVSGGTAPRSYTLARTDGGSPTLPPGLIFDATATARTLSGTPTADAAGTYAMTYAVTDANGSTSTAQPFTVTVADQPIFPVTATQADQTYTQDAAITSFSLPEATGGAGTLSYTLTGPNGTDLTEAPGLAFAATTQVLSGTPTEAGTDGLIYTAIDANSVTAAQTFSVTVVTTPTFQVLQGNLTYTAANPITALSLPAAASSGTPSYTLSSPPTGLAFAPATRVLSGTPTATNTTTTTLTYTATDSTGSVTMTFSVTVNVALSFGTATQGDLNYTATIDIPTLTLPPAAGGTLPLTYTLTGPNGTDLTEVPGLTFAATTRELSGTPSAAGTNTLSYTATDANGATSLLSFSVTVNAFPTLGTQSNLDFTVGLSTPATLPEATGDTATLSYTLTGPNGTDLSESEVDGLTFTATTRVLSGEPTAAGTYAMTYTAIDANDATVVQTFTVTVAAVPTFPTIQAALTFTKDVAIVDQTLPEAMGGHPVGASRTLLYTQTGAPTGLSLQISTRVLSGTPTSAAGTYTLTYTATDANTVAVSQTFGVTVTEDPTFQVPQANLIYPANAAITALTLPAATSSGTPSYTLTGLPTGLSFTATTRVLSGTPTADATTTTTLTYTATDTTASVVQTFSVRVIAEPEFLQTTLDDMTYTVNREITPLTLPAAITAGTTTYDLAPLPDGLLFDAVGRRLTGRPTTLGSTDLSYMVKDANGTSMPITFSVTIIAPTFAATVDEQTYQAGVAISLTLPEAIIGGAAPVYALTGPNGTDLSELPGLVFDSAATSRVLSGTPTAVGTYVLTYTATDVGNNIGTLTFTVVVTAGPTFASTVTDQTYDAGVAITLTLPEATPSVSGTLNYTLVGPNGTDLTEVPGLTFAATTRVLSGTPTTAGTTELTLVATETTADMASVSQTFRVTVTGPTFASTATIDDQFYTAGTAISPLTLPEATTEVSGTLRYALSARTDAVRGLDLPFGLTFTENTRELSGTPTAAGVTELHFMATDANDNTNMPLSFSITVTSTVFVSSVADQIYTLDEDIPNLTLPKATADDGDDAVPYVYTLTSVFGTFLSARLTFNPVEPLANLTFDPTTRVLSGRLSKLDILTVPLLYTAIGPEGGSLVFSITGMEPIRPSFGNDPIYLSDQTYTAGQAITPLVLPQATVESGTPRYVFDSPIPPGLIFNPTTRTLSGTPLGAADNVYEVLYCAYNENNYRSCIVGNRAREFSFLITVAPMPYFSEQVVEQTYPAGVAITALTLPAANGGSGTLAYTLASPNGGLLPTGLSFDATTRALSGTPTAAGTFELTYTAIDSNTLDVASIMFPITVYPGPVFAAAVANQGYVVGALITPLTLPSASGGTGLSYTLTGLPAGLSFAATNRVLSGTPTAATYELLTYTVMDGATSPATNTLTFGVRVAMANAPVFVTAPGDQNYPINQAISPLILPAATGGAGGAGYTLTYTLTGLPTGLSFAATTRALSGTPTVATYELLTYTVTDSNSAATTQTFSVTVEAGATFMTEQTDRTYSAGSLISPVTLPIATRGSSDSLTYTLTDLAEVPGLNFDATTRVLSGTPTTPATTALTYTVTDSDSVATTQTFSVTVQVGLLFTTEQTALTYSVGVALTSLTLPIASGGNGALTYS